MTVTSKRAAGFRFRMPVMIAATAAALGLTPMTGVATDSLLIDEAGQVGLGLETPERQLHIRGPNAQVRIDRPADATSFQLVRTTPDGAVLKSFVFGVLASGPDDGSFFIRDNAQQTVGATDRVRMRIDNAGNTTFQGTVSAVTFNSTSATQFKTDITTLSDADESLRQLRGVRFHWKETGAPSLGLIAEEVAEVFPELVQFDEATGAAQAVNYPALVAVLIEGYKEQQAELQAQRSELVAYRSLFAAQQAQVAQMQERLGQIELRQASLKPLQTLQTLRTGPGAMELGYSPVSLDVSLIEESLTR